MTEEAKPLVDRLRAFVANFDHDITLYEGHPAVLAREAADALERMERRWEDSLSPFGDTAADLSADLAKTLTEVDTANARLTASEAENARLREALKPFALAADNIDDWTDDGSDMWESSAAMAVTAGDFRAARRALEAKP